MIKTIIKFFNLAERYRFDVTDLTALIYLACTIGIMCGANMNLLFFIGSIISTAFCWQAHKINLIVLNAALLILNAYNVIIMIINK